MIDPVRVRDEGLPLPPIGRRDPTDAARLARHLAGQEGDQDEGVRLHPGRREEGTERGGTLKDATGRDDDRETRPAGEGNDSHVVRFRQVEAANADPPVGARHVEELLWNAGAGLADPDQ